MVDAYRLRSPLAHLALDARAEADAARSGTGVVMREIPCRGLINIRGDAADAAFTDAVRKAVRITPPTEANTVAGKASTTRIMWLGPDEWLVITRPEAAERALKVLQKNLKVNGLHAAVTDTTHARTCIEISGPSARDVLRKGCSIDLHPARFGPGQCAQTIVSKVGVMLTQTAAARNGDPTYELYVLRSFSTYLWTWLEDAAQEYGLKVG
ncbi:MAG: sarcosine oxidase subunit gamma family protein [Rhodospirillales bacterium]